MIRVLLADDHHLVLEGLQRVISGATGLAAAGMATSGRAALRRVRAERPDVLVLDLAMPDKSGWEVLRVLRTECPALPVLILSMYPEEPYAARALQAGAAGYLTKSEAPRAVIRAIRQVARGQRYASLRVVQELAAHAGNGPRPNRWPHERLSEREFQVMLQLARGRSTRQIAERLSLSESTVRTYRQRVFAKTGLKSSARLARYATREGLLE